jgi:NDP-sugar pyrophosphorylase family protein
LIRYRPCFGLNINLRRALAALPAGPCQFPELVLGLLERGERVCAFETDAQWHHVGTLEQHAEALRGLGFQSPG